MTTTRKILIGPAGVTLTLDKSQVFPDDPGSATPALVQYRGCTATYWAACDTAEVGDGRNIYGLSPEQMKWLWDQEDDMMKFLFE